MAPQISSHRERARSVWRARKALAEAADDSGRDFAHILERRLHRAVCEAARRLVEDARTWSEDGQTPERSQGLPPGYFVGFAEQVVRTINHWSKHEVRERSKSWQLRLEENTRAYLREMDVYNERLLPGAKPSRMVDRTCMEEQLYLYEPIQYWDQDQQDAMHYVIEERLLRMMPHLEQNFHRAHKHQVEQETEDEDEDWEEEDDIQDSPRRLVEKHRRQTLKADLQSEKRHEDAMFEANDDVRKLEHEVFDLREQIQAMLGAIRAAGTEQERLLHLQGTLKHDVVEANQRTSVEPEASQRSRMEREARNMAEGAARLEAETQEVLRQEVGGSEVVGKAAGKSPPAKGAAMLEANKQDVLRQEVGGSEVVEKAAGKSPHAKMPRTLNKVDEGEGDTRLRPALSSQDKLHLNRRVTDLVKGAEAEQAQDRAKLKLRIKKLEEDIALLRSSRGNYETPQAFSNLSRQPDNILNRYSDISNKTIRTSHKSGRIPNVAEEVANDRESFDQGNVGNENQSAMQPGEEVFKKTAMPNRKTRRIFEKLHEDASDRITRFVVRKGISSGNSFSNNFRLESSVETAKVVHPLNSQFIAAEHQLPVTRNKAKGELATQSKTVIEVMSQPKMSDSSGRPSSTANNQNVLGKPKRASSATTRLVSDTSTSFKKTTQPSDGCFGAGWRKGLPKPAGAWNIDLPKGWEVTSTAASATCLGAHAQRDQTHVTQSGSSVLYSRVPPELAGPARTPLLRSVLEQHHQERVNG